MHANDASTLAVHVHDVVTVMLSPDFLFPRFLVFPPANPSNLSHCILSGFPFLFQYRSIIFYIEVEHQEAVEEAVEFQDRTGVLLLLFIILNCLIRVKCSVAKAGGL